jgi:hypothetical protein
VTMPILRNDWALSPGRSSEGYTALLVFEANLLDRESRASIVIEPSEVIGCQGRVRVRRHSIVSGRSKAVPNRGVPSPKLSVLATEIAVEEHSPWRKSIGVSQRT